MYITLESDYAVRIILYLSQIQKRVEARSISEQTEVTLRFALKILRKLVAAGLVKSFKGTQGGYELNRPPEEISLADVIETVEGPYYLSRCLDPQLGCNRTNRPSPRCKVQREFARISRDVRKRLQNITFDRLV